MQQLQVPHFANKTDYIKWANEQLARGVARQEISHALFPRSQDNLPDGEFIARLEAEHKLSIVMVERNLKGGELEKADQVDEAIKLYEQNVADKAETNYAYHRLRIIYTKQGNLREAMRVCEAFIALDYERVTEAKKSFFLKQLEKLKAKSQSDPDQKPTPKEKMYRFHYALEHVLDKSVFIVERVEWEHLLGTSGEPIKIEKVPPPISGLVSMAAHVTTVGSGIYNPSSGVDVVRFDPADKPYVYNIDHYTVFEHFASDPLYKDALKVARIEETEELDKFIQANVFVVGTYQKGNHWVEEIPEHIKKAKQKN
jgi:tetratricopeptide (TPR) repeat protein